MNTGGDSSDGDRQPIDFSKLELVRVINESTLAKSITFQGIYNGQTVVVRLEKSPFDEGLTKKALNHTGVLAHRNLDNDIYSRYRISQFESTANEIKAIVVCPANERVLAKYSRSNTVFFNETPELYTTVVEPYLVKTAKADQDYNQWVYNILEGRSEADNVIFNDTNQHSGFILLPSLKSSGDDKDLHILAICHRRDIRSLRDLNENHIALLENIQNKSKDAIMNKYAGQKGQLRSYIHYHPTFYHFHVHFEFIDPDSYHASDRDNLLSRVINNVKLLNDYYKRATLTYPLSHSSSLFKELRSKGCL